MRLIFLSHFVCRLTYGFSVWFNGANYSQSNLDLCILSRSESLSEIKPCNLWSFLRHTRWWLFIVFFLKSRSKISQAILQFLTVLIFLGSNFQKKVLNQKSTILLNQFKILLHENSYSPSARVTCSGQGQSFVKLSEGALRSPSFFTKNLFLRGSSSCSHLNPTKVSKFLLLNFQRYSNTKSSE